MTRRRGHTLPLLMLVIALGLPVRQAHGNPHVIGRDVATRAGHECVAWWARVPPIHLMSTPVTATGRGAATTVTVTKLGPSSVISYSTRLSSLGGLNAIGDTWGYGIATDGTGVAYVTGRTDSPAVPPGGPAGPAGPAGRGMAPGVRREPGTS